MCSIQDRVSALNGTWVDLGATLVRVVACVRRPQQHEGTRQQKCYMMWPVMLSLTIRQVLWQCGSVALHVTGISAVLYSRIGVLVCGVHFACACSYQGARVLW